MDEWISRQNALITEARDKQTKTDFHALVEYDPAITECLVNSYVLFTPLVGSCFSDIEGRTRSWRKLNLYDLFLPSGTVTCSTMSGEVLYYFATHSHNVWLYKTSHFTDHSFDVFPCSLTSSYSLLLYKLLHHISLHTEMNEGNRSMGLINSLHKVRK